jgi:hypothetical protein
MIYIYSVSLQVGEKTAFIQTFIIFKLDKYEHKIY